MNESGSGRATAVQPTKGPFSLRDWQPTLGGAFRSILVARLISAFSMHISDCDETYNYWEPVRYGIVLSACYTYTMLCTVLSVNWVHV